MLGSRASLAGLVGISAVGIVVVAFAACVGGKPTPDPGTLDGPCLSNGQCNAGLSCNGSTCEITDDAGVSDANVDDAADAEAGPRQCTFQPTTFPCPQGAACYGAAQGCSLTGCPGGDTDFAWACFGPNQCGNTPCCIPDAAATLTPTPDCSQGGLQMAFVDGGVFGGIPASVCGSGLACPSGDIQLCQFNTQCPKGTVCSPVKVSGSGASASKLLVGACVPE
ncbi:MAG TPA: hypothetical protein VGH28_04555 [Polyangiaceae bacterium]|jgi:hypothetical protein